MTSWPTVKEKVVNLLLDEQNVRIDIQHLSQDAIIQDLFANEDAMQIAGMILENGFFSNELPLVIEEESKYIVLEGNRRVAALKAILNPRLVPSCEVKIIKLINSQNIDFLREIEIKVVPSRSEASKLLAAIHTTTSRRPWRPLRQAYFYYAQVESGRHKIEDLKNEYPNIDISRFVKIWEMHKIAQSIKYDTLDVQLAVKARTFKITTFERIYQNEKFRNKFGFGFDEFGRVHVLAPMDEFKNALKKVIEDIVSGDIDSRTLNKEKQLNDYVATCIPPKGSGQKPRRSGDFQPIVITQKPSPSKLIPRAINTHLGAGVERRLKELQKLPYKTYPNAAHDLLRSLLECSLKAYCEDQGVEIQPRQSGGHISLKDTLVTVREHLKTGTNPKRDLAQVISRILQGPEGFSLKESLDAINHNPHIFSTSEDVKKDWDIISALVEYVLKSNNTKN